MKDLTCQPLNVCDFPSVIWGLHEEKYENAGKEKMNHPIAAT